MNACNPAITQSDSSSASISHPDHARHANGPATVPVQLPEDVMLDIAYAAFRLHGGEEARTMWLLTQPLAARLQPAADTRSLVQRQNNLAGRAASTDRIKCFHDDLGQLGSVPAPLRACALAALGRSILHLPPAEQLRAFQGLLSALVLLPESDRASTMALWPLANLCNSLGLPASHALHGFLKDPANWRGAEDVITVGMPHLIFCKTELLCEIADQIGQQTAPQILFTVLLQLASDPEFWDQPVLMEKLRCELPHCGKGPARLNWLHAAFNGMATRFENFEEFADGAVAELIALASDQPIAEVVRALTERHAAADSHICSAMITVQLTALLKLPVSSDCKAAWTTLVAAAFEIPSSEYRKLRLLELIAKGLCRTLAADELKQTFTQLVMHASRLELTPDKEFFVSAVVTRAVEGMRKVSENAQRIAAFESLLAVIRGMEPAYVVPALRLLVQATSEFVPGKLKTLLDLVLGAEMGLAYSDRANILGAIHLHDRYENFDASRMEEMLTTWLGALEALGGPKLGVLLFEFVSQLASWRITRAMPAIVYKLETAVHGLDKQASGRSLALSALVRICRFLPEQEQMCGLFQRVLMAEQGAVDHLNFIEDALNDILPADSASFEKWVVLAVFDAMLKTGTCMTSFERTAALPRNLTDSDRLEIAMTVLRSVALVKRRDLYPLLSAVNTLVPGTMPANLFQAWNDALSEAPAESQHEVVRLLKLAGRIAAQLEDTERDQALRTLVSHAHAFRNVLTNFRPGISADARQAGFWYSAARRLSWLKRDVQAGAFRFVLAAVNDPRCMATFEERRLVLRKLWRAVGSLPSHLQGGASAALKQALLERRLHSTPEQAAQLHFEIWDDLPHSEVQEASYSPTIASWRAQYDGVFS